MMKQCKKCIFYIKDYDEDFIMHNDVPVEGKEDEELHYCPLFDNPIQTDVFYGDKKCEKFSLCPWEINQDETAL